MASPATSTGTKTKNNLLIIVGAVVVFVLTIVVIGGIVLFVRGQNPPSTITDSDYNIITSGIKFTDAALPGFVYQSPVFNFQLTLDTSKYDFLETSDGLSLYSKNFDDTTSFRVSAEKVGSGTQSDVPKVSADYEATIKSYKSGVIKSNTDVQLDGAAGRKIVSNREGFGGATRHAIAIIVLKDGYLYTLEYTQESAGDLSGDEIGQFSDQFKFIDSSKVETTVNFTSTLWGYQFTYDSKYWKLDSSNNRSESLSPRDFSLAVADKATLDVSSQEISRFDLLGKETTYLSQALQERLGTLQQSKSTYPGLKVTNTSDVSLAGRVAKLIEYEITPQYSSQLVKYKEYLFLHNNAITRITINYGDAAGQGSKQADAVMNTLQFAPPTAGQVKGESTEVEQQEKVSVQAKPAVVRILDITCGNLKVPASSNLQYFSGKTYRICDGGYGSGFFVNSQGYIATNGHVAIFSKATVIYDSLYGLYTKDMLINFFKDYYIKQKGADTLPSDAQIEAALTQNPADRKELALALVQLVSDAKLTLELNPQLYISHGTASFQLNDDFTLSNASDFYKATVVDTDYDASADLDKSTQSDVALLKLDQAGDYPTLKLAPALTVNSGASILVIGYPGVATDLGIINQNNQTEATVSRGIVSAIKQDNSGHNLIQTDASIQHGNSGGPALDMEDNVVGIATYGLEIPGGNYNFLRDIADLQKLMTKNGITNSDGPTEQKWEEGLTFFWSGQYSKSVDSLQAARKTYPLLVDTDSLITVAKDKIASGLDVTANVVSGGLDISAILSKFSATEIILIGVVGVMAALIIALLIAAIRRKPTAQIAYAGLPLAPQTTFVPTPVAQPIAAVVPQPAITAQPTTVLPPLPV